MEQESGNPGRVEVEGNIIGDDLGNNLSPDMLEPVFCNLSSGVMKINELERLSILMKVDVNIIMSLLPPNFTSLMNVTYVQGTDPFVNPDRLELSSDKLTGSANSPEVQVYIFPETKTPNKVRYNLSNGYKYDNAVINANQTGLSLSNGVYYTTSDGVINFYGPDTVSRINVPVEEYADYTFSYDGLNGSHELDIVFYDSEGNVIEEVAPQKQHITHIDCVHDVDLKKSIFTLYDESNNRLPNKDIVCYKSDGIFVETKKTDVNGEYTYIGDGVHFTAFKGDSIYKGSHSKNIGGLI